MIREKKLIKFPRNNTVLNNGGGRPRLFLVVVLACWWWIIGNVGHSRLGHLVAEASSSVAGTETLIGVRGRDFIIIGADSTMSQSIALTASNIDKITVLVDPFPYYNTATMSSTGGDGGNENDQASTKQSESPLVHPDRKQYQYLQQRKRRLHPVIVAAGAGDTADVDRLVQILRAEITFREYESSVGMDVDFMLGIGTMTTTNTATIPTDQCILPPIESGHLSIDAVAHLARYLIANQLRTASPLRVCLLIAGMIPVDPTTAGGGGTTITRDRHKIMSSEPNTELYAANQIQWQIRSSRTKIQSDSEAIPNCEPVIDNAQQKPPQNDLVHDDIILRPRLFWIDEYGSLQNLHYGAHGYGSNFVLSILDQGYRSDLSREEAINLIRSCFAQLRQRYVVNQPQPPCIKCIDGNGCVVVEP